MVIMKDKILIALETVLANKTERDDRLIELEPLLELNHFDWSNWPGRQTLTTSAAIANASADDCYKLLLSTIRSERFSEGTVDSAFESGIIAAIAIRLKSLL